MLKLQQSLHLCSVFEQGMCTKMLISHWQMTCLYLISANYLNNWKCIAVLRGDGTPGPSNGLSMTGQDAKAAMASAFKTQTLLYPWLKQRFSVIIDTYVLLHVLYTEEDRQKNYLLLLVPYRGQLRSNCLAIYKTSINVGRNFVTQFGLL